MQLIIEVPDTICVHVLARHGLLEHLLPDPAFVGQSYINPLLLIVCRQGVSSLASQLIDWSGCGSSIDAYIEMNLNYGALILAKG